jgi:hypothetical protein
MRWLDSISGWLIASARPVSPLLSRGAGMTVTLSLPVQLVKGKRHAKGSPDSPYIWYKNILPRRRLSDCFYSHTRQRSPIRDRLLVPTTVSLPAADIRWCSYGILVYALSPGSSLYTPVPQLLFSGWSTAFIDATATIGNLFLPYRKACLHRTIALFHLFLLLVWFTSVTFSPQQNAYHVLRSNAPIAEGYRNGCLNLFLRLGIFAG